MPNFSGLWTVTQQMQAKGQSIWPAIPGAPTIGTATRGNASASITFTAPADTGYPTTLTFTATSSPSGFTGTSSSSPVTVSGLSNGTAYTFTVTATNASGTGPASSASNSVTPATVPGAPTIGTATQTSLSTATVVYTAPADNGGSPITSYTATSSPAGGTGTLSQAGSGTITVTGLSANTSYTFTVTATNAIGTSAASAASNSITTPLPAIGEAFGGGFYTGQIGVAGVATHYIIVGPKSSAQSAKAWKNVNTATPGADSVIDGPQNTADMVADGNATVYPAAHFCNDLAVGSQTDWYMPAKNELEICYYNLKPTAQSNNTTTGANTNAVPSRGSNYTTGDPAQTTATDFQGNNSEAFGTGGGGVGRYWASTENTTTLAWRQYFYNGAQAGSYKQTSAYQVRAVRRVAV